MARTVIIHRPTVAGSTMRVTEKAFRAAYASDGYMEGVREGDPTPGLDHHHAADLKRTEAQLAAVLAQLREAQAERDAIAAQHAAGATPPAAAPPRTDNPPAKRAPRKRVRPAKAAAPAAAPDQAPDPAAMVTRADTVPEPSPGPPDIASTPALD